MKKLILLILTSVSAFAQSYAPESIADKVFNTVITSGTGPYATSGTAAIVFTASGSYFVIATSGDIAEETGTYTYTRQSGTKGLVVLDPGTDFASTTTVTFTNELGGTYIATTTGGGGGTQTGAFSLSPFSPTPPLVNMSARATLTAGERLTPGFVISGAVPRTILIRGVGPGLLPLGVGNAMADPKLTLYSGQTPIETNDNWQSADGDVFGPVGAFSLPAGSKDAVIVTTLQPGSYTAAVEGATPTQAGEVIVEVYLID